eukprot:gene4298-5378_t
MDICNNIDNNNYKDDDNGGNYKEYSTTTTTTTTTSTTTATTISSSTSTFNNDDIINDNNNNNNKNDNNEINNNFIKQQQQPKTTLKQLLEESNNNNFKNINNNNNNLQTNNNNNSFSLSTSPSSNTTTASSHNNIILNSTTSESSPKWKYGSSPGRIRAVTTNSNFLPPPPTFHLITPPPELQKNKSLNNLSSYIVAIGNQNNSELTGGNTGAIPIPISSQSPHHPQQEQMIPEMSMSLPTSVFSSNNFSPPSTMSNNNNNNNGKSTMASSPPSSSVNGGGVPMSPRKQTLMGKFKYMFHSSSSSSTASSATTTPPTTPTSITTTPPTTPHHHDEDDKPKSSFVPKSSSKSNNNASTPTQQQQQNNNNNIQPQQQPIKDKFTTDLFKIFQLPSTEIIVSEHPCAYRRKVSKAGKIYITSNYFCFYSLIFNKEIKKISHFKDITNIRKISSIIIGNSIEISTNYKKYVFGMFEKTENAYQSLMKQYSLVSISHPPSNNLLIIDSSKKSLKLQQQQQNGSGSAVVIGSPEKDNITKRARFLSVSTSVNNNNNSNSSNNSGESTGVRGSEQQLLRSRSGSLPSSYSKAKKDYILSPVKDKQFSGHQENSNGNHQLIVIDNQATIIDHSNNVETPSSPQANINKLQEIQKKREKHKSITFGSNILVSIFGANSNNNSDSNNSSPNSTTPPPEIESINNNNNNNIVNNNSTDVSIQSSENESNNNNTPVKNRERSFTNSIINPFKFKKVHLKNKDSLDKINRMLITRSSRDDVNQYCFKEDVFGIQLEAMRLMDDQPCPIFIHKLLQYLETSTPNPTIYSIYLTDLNQVLESQSQGESHIQVLIRSVIRGKEDAYKYFNADPRLVSELLIHFFQQLPQPILPPEFLLSCTDIQTETYKLSYCRSIIFSQPQSNWSLLKLLLQHFIKLIYPPKEEEKQNVVENQKDQEEVKSEIVKVDNINVDNSLDNSNINNNNDEEKQSDSLINQAGNNENNNNNNNNTIKLEEPPKFTETELIKKISVIFGPLIFKTNNTHSIEYDRSIDIFNYIIQNYDKIISDNYNNCQYVFKKGNQVLKQSTVDSIILKLTDIYYKDDTLLDTFNLTHHDYYLPTDKYLEKLIEIYAQHLDSDSLWQSKLRERILYLIKTLIEFKPMFWSSNIEGLLSIEIIKRFTQHYAPSSISLPKSTLSLIMQPQSQLHLQQQDSNSETKYFLFFNDFCTNILEDPLKHQQQLEDKNSSSNSSLFTMPSHNPEFLLGASRIQDSKKFQIAELDATQIAIQITLIDEKAFRSIPVQELLQKKFSKHEQSPNFQSMVQLFNRWSSWVGSEILLYTSPSQRALVIEKFIEIAMLLQNLKNYHSCYSITQGIYHYSIKRLYLTWDKISKKSLNNLMELQKIFSTESNHKNYRELLNSSKPPLIPYLGLYPKDLFIVEDSNPTKLANDVINLEKMRLINQTIKYWRYYRENPYPMKSAPVLKQKILSRPILNDDEMFEKSLLLEPRKQTAAPVPNWWANPQNNPINQQQQQSMSSPVAAGNNNS